VRRHTKGCVVALDWDVKNEDCSDISDWTDGDQGICESTQATFDSRSCFKLYCPSSATSGQQAWRYISTGLTIPDTFTFEFNYYNDEVGDFGGLNWSIYTQSSHRYRCAFYGNTFTFYFSGTNTWFAIPTGTGLDQWNTFRMVVKTGRKADIWMNNRCYAADRTCSYTHATQTDDVYLFAFASTSGNTTVYCDDFKIDTTPEAPISVSPLKIGDEHITHRAAQIDIAGFDPVSPLVIQAKGLDTESVYGACGIELVATTSTVASKVYIYDGSTTKALQKLPS